MLIHSLTCSSSWGPIKLGYKITFSALPKQVPIASTGPDPAVAEKQAAKEIREAARARCEEAAQQSKALFEALSLWHESLLSTRDADDDICPEDSDSLDAEELWMKLSARSAEVNGRLKSIQTFLAWLDSTTSSPSPVTRPASVPQPRPRSVDAFLLAEYKCDSLKIPAAKDFRVEIPIDMLSDDNSDDSICIEWQVSLVQASTAVKANHNLTLGFSVVERGRDGLLPQLEAYRVIKGAGSAHDTFLIRPSIDSDANRCRTFIFVFDNTFSWYNPKFVSYRIAVLRSPALPEASSPESPRMEVENQSSSKLTVSTENEWDSTIAVDKLLAEVSEDDIEPSIPIEHDLGPSDGDAVHTELASWVGRVLRFAADSASS